MGLKIAVAGASGFIGKWIIEKFHRDYEIIALSRKRVYKKIRGNVKWRQVDLYSMSSTEKSLKGVDIGIYLVHSMQPSTRLSQGKFEDTDLLLRVFKLCVQRIELLLILESDRSKPVIVNFP